MPDNTQQLIDQVQSAHRNNSTLKIVGGNSKDFLQACNANDRLEMTSHAGVVNYEPTELVLTARAGTPIVEIEKLLADNGQYLSFEPPHFSENTTIGGAVASGMGGPRRPWGGAPRDVLLGCRLLTGTGDVMRFGGEVMKNVAGYDVSRLMAGAQGSLGVLLEVSLKVLPAPSKTITLTQGLSETEAHQTMRELAAKPIPLSGVCFANGQLYIRLSGAHASVATVTVVEKLYPDLATSKKRGRGGVTDDRGNGVAKTVKPRLKIKGVNPGVAITLARCCHPLPGEDIVGIFTTGKGVTVHRVDCPTLVDFNDTPELWMDVAWEREGPRRFLGRLEMVLSNEPGALAAVATIIGQQNGNISNIRLTERSTDFFSFQLDLEVKDVEHMRTVIAVLQANDFVERVQRASNA